MTVKLTAKIIAELTVPARGNQITYDSEVPGFGVRVTAGGSRAFVLNYRTRAGRERRYTIGKVGVWQVAAARHEAKRLLLEIRANGIDPLEQLETARQAPTVGELADRYVREHLPTKRPRSQREDLDMLRLYVLPELEHRKVADLAFADISTLHRKLTLADKPFRANRVLALLSKMLTLAVLWKMRPDNPCRNVGRNHEEGRERYLSQDEVSRLMRALTEYPDREAANLIVLALLTGARRGEILKATWGQFDLGAGTWTKPSAHTKQAKVHRIPLSPAAVELLTSMKATAISERLFSRADIRDAWEKVRYAAGLADVRFHDLRHSYASLLVGAGYSLPLIGKLLGHTRPETTARYAHLADDPLREATAHVGRLVGK